MGKEKLTLADCFKYPNAKIAPYNNIYEMIQSFYFGEDLIYYSLDDCNNAFESTLMASQLKLRPLSDLTEGEESNIGNLLCNVGIDWDNVKTLDDLCSYHYGKSKDLIDYLRSINIDIDGFIEAGKAVAE